MILLLVVVAGNAVMLAAAVIPSVVPQLRQRLTDRRSALRDGYLIILWLLLASPVWLAILDTLLIREEDSNPVVAGVLAGSVVTVAFLPGLAAVVIRLVMILLGTRRANSRP